MIHTKELKEAEVDTSGVKEVKPQLVVTRVTTQEAEEEAEVAEEGTKEMMFNTTLMSKNTNKKKKWKIMKAMDLSLSPKMR
jgi:hypothetical protein